MNEAWMFPGQGSQAPGMARRLFEKYAIAREILAEASQLAGHDLNAIRQRGPVSALRVPANTELLLAATQIAYANILMETGRRPTAVAGYSAGETAACYVAGVLSRGEALKAAWIRGTVLNEFCNDKICMLAVSRVPNEKLLGLLSDSGAGVEVAAWNGPWNVTLVGTRDRLLGLARDLRVLGASIGEVDVAGPWHSRTIELASQRIVERLQCVEFQAPRIALALSATGKAESDPTKIRQGLAAQVSLAVQWQSITEGWRQQGINDSSKWDRGAC